MHQLWGVTSPAEAREKLAEVQIPCDNPQNAEQWLLSQVGREIYELFFRGYTKKQWFKEPRDLPASIVTRLPIRLTYNDAYFATKYQAIPRNGYTHVFRNMLDGIDVELGVDFYSLRNKWKEKARHLVFTGPIDQFYDYEHGRLEHRSMRFDLEIREGDFQGHAVVNYPAEDVEFLRIIEHKHFLDSGPKHVRQAQDGKTVITRDIPLPPDHQKSISDPQYPIRDEPNLEVLRRYTLIADQNQSILFGGRLGEYRYYDIDQAIASAIRKAHRIIEGRASSRGVKNSNDGEAL